MGEPGQLGVNDRVLLHLSLYATDIPPEEYPPDIAQVGIAAGVGISRTHVPRAVKGLIADGLVRELTARVKGHDRRMSIYVTTAEGQRRVDAIWKGLMDRPLSVEQAGATQTMTVSQLEGIVGHKRAVRAMSRSKGNLVEIDEGPRKAIRDLASAPEVSEFYGREQELGAIQRFIESDSRALIVMGNHGYGTTTLVRRFLDNEEDCDALWVSLAQRSTVTELQEALLSYARKLDPEVQTWAGALALQDAVIAFDGYFQVTEEVVEFFASLIETECGARLVITAREDTPAYNWFYQRRHLDSGTVTELRIRGLSEEGARRLLGAETAESDAFRRIYGMTRGQPMLMKMLREGDYEGLKKMTIFTPEEVRYLLFLKEKAV